MQDFALIMGFHLTVSLWSTVFLTKESRYRLAIGRRDDLG